jgi:hypothetical protein
MMRLTAFYLFILRSADTLRNPSKDGRTRWRPAEATFGGECTLGRHPARHASRDGNLGSRRSPVRAGSTAPGRLGHFISLSWSFLHAQEFANDWQDCPAVLASAYK